MSWATKYIGLPYREKGRDRTGLDCWGLVRYVLHEERGLTLPSYTEDYATSQDTHEIEALMRGEIVSHWTTIAVADAQPFDGIVLRMLGHPIHFGLVVAPPYFMHALRGAGTVLERWDSLMWQKRVLGAARWNW